MKEWKPDPNAWVEEQVEKKAQDGTITRRAKRDGLSYGEAVIALCEELRFYDSPAANGAVLRLGDMPADFLKAKFGRWLA
jgi:hypothetical protein